MDLTQLVLEAQAVQLPPPALEIEFFEGEHVVYLSGREYAVKVLINYFTLHFLCIQLTWERGSIGDAESFLPCKASALNCAMGEAWGTLYGDLNSFVGVRAALLDQHLLVMESRTAQAEHHNVWLIHLLQCP